MLDQKLAQELSKPLQQLLGFPRDRKERKAIMAAARAAVSPAVLRTVVQNWTSRSYAPSQAELLNSVVAENIRATQRRRNCLECNGEGSVTRYYLVNYRGAHKVESMERIRPIGNQSAFEVAMEMKAMLGPNQNILTGADDCPSCTISPAFSTSEPRTEKKC
jgi:hypothetical protein